MPTRSSARHRAPAQHARSTPAQDAAARPHSTPAGTIWWARRTVGVGSGGRVLGVMFRAATWHKARARASVELGKRYGHDLCAPELLEVTMGEHSAEALVLEVLRRGPTARKVIISEVGLPETAVHRAMTSLVERGLVVRPAERGEPWSLR